MPTVLTPTVPAWPPKGDYTSLDGLRLPGRVYVEFIRRDVRTAAMVCCGSAISGREAAVAWPGT